MPNTKTKGIKLNKDILNQLKALAKLRRRSPQRLMKQALEAYLEQEERYGREKREDEERWERYQLTGESVPHDVASDWLKQLAHGKAASCPK